MANFAKTIPKYPLQDSQFLFWVVKWQFFPQKTHQTQCFFSIFYFASVDVFLFFSKPSPQKITICTFLPTISTKLEWNEQHIQTLFLFTTNSVQKNKKVFPQNILIVFQSFHLINDLLTSSICKHGWQSYSQFQGSNNSLLYQHLKKLSIFHMC